MIELAGINKIYGEGRAALHVLKDVDFTVREREFVAILGASGSGKSTLMNIIGCLDRPSSGSYRLRDADVSRMDDDRLSEIRPSSTRAFRRGGGTSVLGRCSTSWDSATARAMCPRNCPEVRGSARRSRGRS